MNTLKYVINLHTRSGWGWGWFVWSPAQTALRSMACYARFSNEDPAKCGSKSRRILNVEGVFFLVHRVTNFLAQRLQNLDSKDLGLKGLSMQNVH